MGLTGWKSRCWQGCFPSGGSGMNLFPCLFTSRSSPFLTLWSFTPIFKDSNTASLFSSSIIISLSLTLLFCLNIPRVRTLVIRLGWPIIQDNHHIIKSLTWSHMQNPLRHVRWHSHRFQVLERGRLWGSRRNIDLPASMLIDFFFKLGHLKNCSKILETDISG